MTNYFLSDLIFNAVPVIIVVVLAIVIIRAKQQPLWAEAYRRLGRNKIAIVSMVLISLYCAVALLDSFGTSDPKTGVRVTLLDHIAERPLERTYSAPFASETTGEPHPHTLNQPKSHILGTDTVGNDVLYRSLKGVRTAIIIGGLTSLIATPLALLFGLLAGYYGKFTDDAIQYSYTTLSSIPDVLVIISLVMMLGQGIVQICLAVGITSWVGLTRLVRGETLKHRDREYIRAAKSLGVSNGRILFRHLLPNLLPIVIISVTLSFSGFILYEPVLTYLQVGLPPDVGSWGNMIDAARDELSREPLIWWNLTGASVALFGLVLSLNFFGDALRDAIDPRLRS